MKATKTTTDEVLDVLEVKQGRSAFCVLGTRPLISNRMSAKAQHQLLLPAPKKNATERATSLKHDPYTEFRASAHRYVDESSATYLGIPSAAFKKGMMAAALDLPGTKKTQIGRLTWVTGDMVPVYGLPQLFMSVVRSADMNRTPDVRTRCIVPEWAAQVTVDYVQPLMQPQAVLRLLAAAGLYIGVGDWRNEKGSGTYGSFELVEPTDERYQRLLQYGRAAQVQAMEQAVPYADAETEELLSWFDAERNKRAMKGAA